MNRHIDTKRRRAIRNTLKAIKQMMPIIRQEIQEIINTKSNSERRVERNLESLLGYLHWGYGAKEFGRLNEYYYSLDDERAAHYQYLFTELTVNDPVDPVILDMIDPEPVLLNIQEEPTEKTKEFMKVLFEADIPGCWHRFTKVDINVSYARRKDTQMTYETFIENIKENKIAKLELNKRERVPSGSSKKVNAIRFWVRGVLLPDSTHIERIVCYCIPINSGDFRHHPNYKTVDKLFENVFDLNMETYEKL